MGYPTRQGGVINHVFWVIGSLNLIWATNDKSSDLCWYLTSTVIYGRRRSGNFVHGFVPWSNQLRDTWVPKTLHVMNRLSAHGAVSINRIVKCQCVSTISLAVSTRILGSWLSVVINFLPLWHSVFNHLFECNWATTTDCCLCVKKWLSNWYCRL